ncbi:MAG: OmpA family protein [Acetobacteraceae bacterium]|nr:OmpA family protein [Acetobacteraceae bacterium]
MPFRKALFAASVLALPLAAPAMAQPVEGVYVGAGAGLNYRQDDRATFACCVPGATVSNDYRYDLGWGGSLSLGYGFGNGLRAEIEGSYRRNGLDRVRVRDSFGFNELLGSLSGSGSTYGVMVNALYDFDLGIGVVPYVGAGVGWMWNEFSVRGVASGPTLVTVSGSGSNFAYQEILGAALPIAEVPGLALTAEYRFLGTLGTDSRLRISFPIPPDETRRGGDVSAMHHSLFLGIRYAFGVAPAPAPAAAPEPARTYLVFFDWDRDTLTDRARQIIADAAAASRRVQSTRIEVSGHADRSGSPQYNQGLSLRRANNVAAELVRLGVPRNEIVIQAFGETRPLVPTADGVREPQNRRVEIVLR